MKKYYTLGENIFYESIYDGEVVALIFKDNKVLLRFEVSENIEKLAEEVEYWKYKKLINLRVKNENRVAKV